VPARRKYDEETMARAVRMYRDRVAEDDQISQRRRDRSGQYR